MARSRYCRICKDFHDLEQAWPEACAGHFGHQGDDAGFYVIGDATEPFMSHASGRMHDSKSAYRRELRAMGCYEVGNDKQTRTVHARPPVGPDIKRAIEQLKNR